METAPLDLLYNANAIAVVPALRQRLVENQEVEVGRIVKEQRPHRRHLHCQQTVEIKNFVYTLYG